MNATLKTSYRMLWTAYKRAVKETVNTIGQNIKAIVYLSKSERKREVEKRIERLFREIKNV